MKKTKKMLAPRNAVEQTIQTFLCGVLALHTGTQILHSSTNLYNRFFPSEARAQFQEVYGINLIGTREDIEEKRIIPKLAEIIDREQQERPFSLDSIEIISPNFFKQSIPQQANIVSKNIGLYAKGKIVLKSRFLLNTLPHEIKHKKEEEITAAHPRFKRKWHRLAQGDHE